ncbi:MAG: DNA adenine methylase [Phycisphaeraceae bacterium]
MIKYLGSKRTLLPKILQVVGSFGSDQSTIIDLFSGTSRVGHALKAAGYRVLANDHNAYAATLARCYVQADREDHLHDAKQLVAEFNTMPGQPGYITKTFCEQARYFQPKNGERIDAIREAIARKNLDPELEAVMLVSLMEAADRIDSTTGVQMAYLKSWAARSHKDLELRVPNLLPQAAGGKGQATQLDAIEAAQQLDADVIYLDPPYNQHSYLGNYHIWETLVRWDAPEAYGIARKRIDCRERASAFNSKKKFNNVMRDLLGALRCRALVVSFNNEGYIDRPAMEAMLATCFDGKAHVLTLEHDYKRYVGAQIGIHNLKGVKVGKVSHLRNKEYLYIVTADASLLERLQPDTTEVQEVMFTTD